MKLTIKYTATAPISHIGNNASVGSYFQKIATANGKLPIITANSVRGVLRDKGATYLLDTVQSKVSKEIFNILFSGGTLSGSTSDNIGKATAVRQHFPLISLFGGGLGDMILAGKMAVGNLYPICEETYEDLGEPYTDISWRKLLNEIEFTRTDDAKKDSLSGYMTDPTAEKVGKVSTQLRFEVQYMAKGTQFKQDIYLMDTVNDLEKGALYSAFAEWFKMPVLGGMASKGFGFFDAETDFGISVKNGNVSISPDTQELINKYTEFIESEKDEYFDVMAVKKSGKK